MTTRAFVCSAGLAALLLAASCGAPQAPPPPAPPPAPAPAVATPSGAPPWVELTGTRKETRLVGHDAGGHRSYDLPLPGVIEVVPASDGGAFAAVQATGDGGTPASALLRLDPKGEIAWRLEIPLAPWGFWLAASQERLLAYHAGDKRLFVIDPDRGVRLHDRVLDTPPLATGGDVVVTAEAGVVTRLSFDGEPLWSAHLRSFPTTRAAAAAPSPKLAVGSDGTVLAGGPDGAVVALDRDGNGLFQLGVRGAVTRIEAREGGVFAVRSEGGGVTVVGPGGAVLREGADDAGSAASAPKRVVDSRSDAHRDAAPSKPADAPAWRATAAYRVRRDGPGGAPFDRVVSVAAFAPDDVWALGQATYAPGSDDTEDRLYHYDGHVWSDEGKPKVRFAKEVFAAGKPAAVGTFEPSVLGRSPRGNLIVIGKRADGYTRRLCVLERSGKELRERRELYALLAKIEPRYDVPPSYAASPGGREVVCAGTPEGCVEVRGGAPPRVLSVSEGRTVAPSATKDRPGPSASVLFAGEELWRTAGWARDERDLWSVEGPSLARWDGAAIEDVAHPLVTLASAWSSGPDDLWVTGKDGDTLSGLAHYDGRRWWRVLGVEPEWGKPLSVVGAARGDVWAFGPSGLWHVTPEPKARPDVEGTVTPPPPAAPPSLPLAVAGVDASYRLERVAPNVDGGRPMRAALGIVEGPGGVVWMHDGARVVEVDGDRARVLFEAPKAAPYVCAFAPEPDCDACVDCTERRPREIPCQRCLAPVGAGDGGAITEQGWLRLRGGSVAPETMPLLSPTAVGASPAGTIWAVSADDERPNATVQGPQGVGFVTGLPPAVYVDVAARADDDVWMAGGLSQLDASAVSRPAGEGTLVRFDGRAFTRHRGPDGALLAVAALSPGEALAVGVGGGLLHVKAGVSTAWHLVDADGRRLGTILRGVATDGAGGAWIVGDGGTLLRWDGATLRRVDASAAGRDAALSAIVAPATRPGWVAGPGGIFRLVPAR